MYQAIESLSAKIYTGLRFIFSSYTFIYVCELCLFRLNVESGLPIFIIIFLPRDFILLREF